MANSIALIVVPSKSIANSGMSFLREGVNLLPSGYQTDFWAVDLGDVLPSLCSPNKETLSFIEILCGERRDQSQDDAAGINFNLSKADILSRYAGFIDFRENLQLNGKFPDNMAWENDRELFAFLDLWADALRSALKQNAHAIYCTY